MGGGFLYFGILLFFFLLVAGMVTLLISIFYIGEWMEKKKSKPRPRNDPPL